MQKEMYIALIAAGVTLMVVGGIGTVSAYTLVGDMTGDGKVDAKDITAMRVAVAGSGLTVEQLASMPQLGVSANATLEDMNGDGRFYYDDIEIIRSIYSGTANVYGDNDGGRPPVGETTIVVGDVDGDGVFDWNDMGALIQVGNPRCTQGLFTWLMNFCQVTLNQITRSI